MKTAAFCIISTPRDYHVRAGWLHVVIWRQSRGAWAIHARDGVVCVDTPIFRMYWGG